MAEDTEKKFRSIMDKLFHFPSSPGLKLSKGFKRPNQVNNDLAFVDPRSRIPSGGEEVRLWHRGDLMRRMSTVKS